MNIFSAITRIVASAILFSIAFLAYLGVPFSRLDHNSFMLLLFGSSLLMLTDGVRFLIDRK